MEGAWYLASSNRTCPHTTGRVEAPREGPGPGEPERDTPTLTSFSESPLHLLMMLEAEMLKKVVLHSVATALASSVFPVPAGRWRRGGETGGHAEGWKEAAANAFSEGKSLTWGAIEQQSLPRGHQSREQLWVLSEKMQIRHGEHARAQQPHTLQRSQITLNLRAVKSAH